jgi:hypothetical protein
MERLTLSQNYIGVPGKCLVVELKKFLKVGGFDIKNSAATSWISISV